MPVDRSTLIRAAREALAALDDKERDALFTEFGLRELAMKFKSLTAQLGALVGGVFGALASESKEKTAHAPDCKGAKLGAGWCCKPVEKASLLRNPPRWDAWTDKRTGEAMLSRVEGDHVYVRPVHTIHEPAYMTKDEFEKRFGASVRAGRSTST